MGCSLLLTCCLVVGCVVLTYCLVGGCVVLTCCHAVPRVTLTCCCLAVYIVHAVLLGWMCKDSSVKEELLEKIFRHAKDELAQVLSPSS